MRAEIGVIEWEAPEGCGSTEHPDIGGQKARDGD